jgi:putative phosphoribosyl transferase
VDRVEEALPMRFRDRADAGRRLAQELRPLGLVEPLVLALPRGGVPVGYEIARDLHAPLDVLVARKVGAPDQPERGIGAIAEGGGEAVDADAIRALGLSAEQFRELVEEARVELDRRVMRYRGSRPLISVEGHDVVVVDDGLATGVTAEAALRSLRSREPRRLVLAVPAGAREAVGRLTGIADDIVCVVAPPDFFAVGQWYERFEQTSDEEVVDLLRQ